jgi:hypothetical protein
MTRIARWTRWTASALAVLLMLIGTFGVAAAENRGATTPPPPTSYGELEQLYRLRKQQLRSLDEMLTRDERRAVEVEQLIAYAKGKGKDTAALERALATYRATLGSARAAWKIAFEVLKTHAGFNDAGHVTNPDQARATLKSAENALYKCYRMTHYAEELLARALAEFRNQK